MKSLPNILTGGRLVLSLAVLVCLADAGGWIPGVPFGDSTKLHLEAIAFVAFVVAAVTDFFDGWLARRMGAVSLLGAILDPIADKVLVVAALLGLLALGAGYVALPGGLILFREFSVSAMRESLAPRGLKLPVTLFAKWKTTLQLVALALLLFLPLWSAIGLPADVQTLTRAEMLGTALIWFAALVTLWTGVEYTLAARRALEAIRPPASPTP
jgi:CDP-diacylglycerol--glycerol-3-phosphate 3-phosphatidyltransferase